MSVHLGVKTADDFIRVPAEPFQFPGGEWHLRNICDCRDPSATWIADVRGASADDLVKAALFADVAHRRQASFVLFLPYIPAARADRAFLNEQPLGVAVYSQIIASMNPQRVIAIDPHSPVAGRYLHNLTELSLGPLLRRALGYDDAVFSQWADHYDAVIAPDKGAVRRAQDACGYLGRWGIDGMLGHWGTDVYHAEKHRDEATGKILDIKMTEPLPKSGRYLVVDDICDGGGTFMGLAKATGLPKERLGLWVTHGIFSGNAVALREHYQDIYTTDSHPGHGRFDGKSVATCIVPCVAYMLNQLKESDERLDGPSEPGTGGGAGTPARA